MAKHWMPKKPRAGKAALVGVVAAGICSALVLGHATNTATANFMVELSNTVIGAGGQGDSLSARVPAKLSKTVVPDDYGYYAVEYPATVNLRHSRDVGLPIMHTAIIGRSTEQHLIVASYSSGSLLAEKERRNLQALGASVAPSHAQLSFLQIASPFAGDGGIYGRFPGIAIPGVTDAMGAGQATRYDTTYVAGEYDPYADFPAYFNPLSLANSFLAIRYGHPDAYYDPIRPGTSPAYVTTVENTVLGSTDTYVLYYSAHLPLLGPVRELSGLMNLTPLTEPVLSAVEPLLRLVIDAGYTDRVNANPATPTPFSLFTPPAKVLEALAGLPGALTQGATNLLNGGHPVGTPPDPHGNLVPAASLVTLSSRAPDIQGQARMSNVPAAEPRPRPLAKIGDSPPKSWHRPTPTPTATATSTPTTTSDNARDGLHPTLVSDGNKVTPGGTSTDDSPTSGAAPVTSTSITATGTTGTTETTGTTGSTDGAATDHETPAGNAA